MSKIYEEIFDAVQSLTIIDTHEHLCEEDQIASPPDLLDTYLFHYFRVDVLTAGLTQDKISIVLDKGIPVKDRWKIVEPYWEASRLTGYGQALDIAVKKIYGVDRIDSDTIEKLSQLFTQQAVPGHYRHVLSDLCNIRISINDMKLCENPLFKFVTRIDSMVYIRTKEDMINQGASVGIRVHSLEDFENTCEKLLDKQIKAGAIGLKCGLAYYRSLKFEKVSRTAAQDIFARLMSRNGTDASALNTFQNYMMHYVLSLADKREMVMQVHTGILEGIGYYLPHSDPILLNNLFPEYSNVKFDLFHIGFPFHNTVATLVKMFPNVFVDMAWAHIVSPVTCVNILGEWLESIPVTKIMGFGGDYCFVDGVYGHQYIARRNIARALAAKVEAGLIDTARAKALARTILFDNPKALFSLDV